MKTYEERLEYNRERQRYYGMYGHSKEDKPYQFKITKGDEIKYFKNRWDLAAFLGYDADYVSHCRLRGIKLRGYIIEKFQWWKVQEQTINSYKYKAMNLSDKTDIRFFHSYSELAEFLGYSENRVGICVRAHKPIQNYLCEKI